MSWNYRIIKKTISNHLTSGIDIFYDMHEVYYCEKGEPNGWTVNPVPPRGDTPEELAASLEMMQSALKKPVLEECPETGKLVEVHPDELIGGHFESN